MAMAESVGAGDDKTVGLSESSQQFGEGSKDVRGMGDSGEAGFQGDEIDIARVERVYKYLTLSSREVRLTR